MDLFICCCRSSVPGFGSNATREKSSGSLGPLCNARVAKFERVVQVIAALPPPPFQKAKFIATKAVPTLTSSTFSLARRLCASPGLLPGPCGVGAQNVLLLVSQLHQDMAFCLKWRIAFLSGRIPPHTILDALLCALCLRP